MPDDREHPLLAIPMLREVITNCDPQLTRNTPEHRRTLDAIQEYLFEHDRLVSKSLQKLLGDNFYHTLHGLKSMLQNMNLNILEWAMENHQEKYGTWLQQELDNQSTQPPKRSHPKKSNDSDNQLKF